MKKLFLAGLVGLTVSLMAGCASTPPPTQQQIESADYGKLPDNYKEQIQGAMSVTLKEPYSAQYSFLEPFKAYSQDGPWSPSKGAVNYGWAIPVMVNAKNSYGGYTGAKRYVYMFSGGTLYDVSWNDQFGRVIPVK